MSDQNLSSWEDQEGGGLALLAETEGDGNGNEDGDQNGYEDDEDGRGSDIDFVEAELDLELERQDYIHDSADNYLHQYSNMQIHSPPDCHHAHSFLQSFLRFLFTGRFNSEFDVDNRLFAGEDVDELALFQPLYSNDSNIKKNFPDWSQILYNENCCVWEHRCKQLMPKCVLFSPIMKVVNSYRGKLRAFLGAWNPSNEHCSSNIFLLGDRLTAHRVPAVNQTDAVRGKLGFSRGVHAWDIRIMGIMGTHLSIGVATDQAELSTKGGYMSLVGNDEHSWGWDLVWGNLSTGGKNIAVYPERTIYDHRQGDIIRMILDCEHDVVSFEVNGVGFGKAFVNLPKKTLYPSVSLVYGNARVYLVYLGDPASTELPL